MGTWLAIINGLVSSIVDSNYSSAIGDWSIVRAEVDCGWYIDFSMTIIFRNRPFQLLS